MTQFPTSPNLVLQILRRQMHELLIAANACEGQSFRHGGCGVGQVLKYRQDCRLFEDHFLYQKLTQRYKHSAP